eukprot:scaffold3831_cov112-Isochrysis_galbana.AAC.1
MPSTPQQASVLPPVAPIPHSHGYQPPMSSTAAPCHPGDAHERARGSTLLPLGKGVPPPPCPGNGAPPPISTQGAIGVAVRIVALDAPPPNLAAAEVVGGLEPPTSASVVGAFRFRVRRLVSSFPFVTAEVEPFAD